MAVLCGGSKWSCSLAQLPIQKAGAKADAGRLFAPLVTQRRCFSPLHCTDPFKSSPVSSSQPRTTVAGDSEEEKEEEAPESPFEVSLGKFLRGRLWFLILVFLLTACGAGYSYLVFTFADVADVPILGVTRW